MTSSQDNPYEATIYLQQEVNALRLRNAELEQHNQQLEASLSHQQKQIRGIFKGLLNYDVDDLLIELSHGLEDKFSLEERNPSLAQKVAGVGIWELDISNQSITWSEELDHMMGVQTGHGRLSLDEVIKSCHPEDRSRMQRAIAHSAITGEPLALKIKIVQPGGDVRHLEIKGKTLVNEQGQITHLFGATLDVTECEQLTTVLHQLNQTLEDRVLQRTQQLQQRAEQERLLRSITEQIRRSLELDQILSSTVEEVWQALGADRALIFRLKLNGGSVVYKESVSFPYPTIANLGWEEEWFPPDCHAYYLQGNPRIVPNVATDEWGACLAEFMQSVGVKSKIVAPIVARAEDGSSWVWGLLTVHACSHYRQWQEEEANFLQQIANQLAIAICQARLYEAVQGQVEELKQLHLLKDDFLSTVSHELRSPMSSIKMAVQMLEICLERLGILDSEDQQLQRYFQILKDECQREINLINDLLDLARVETEIDLPPFTPIDLSLWFPQITEAFVERTRQQQQNLTITLSDDLPPLLTVPAYLERIVTELLHNACKYTPAGEAIIVTAKLTDEKKAILIDVTNTGVEISDAECDRIFEKFYRIPNNDPWKHGGTGLGLALVKKLVEALGGTIQVHSRNQCTAFALCFPLIEVN